VPKSVTVEVPYYKVVDVPIQISTTSNQPPPEENALQNIPQTVPPLPASPRQPPTINYGRLPAGVFKPPRRRAQKEEVNNITGRS